MGKREENYHQTYQKLLASAERLIIKDGYENVSVDRIVKDSGIAKGTFYNYFRRKEDLIFELSKQHFSNVKIQVTEKSDPIETLTTYLINYVMVIKKAGVQLARQWVRYISASSNNKSKLKYDISLMSDLLTDLVKMNKLSQNLPIEKFARLLIVQAYGGVLTWCIAPDNIDPVELISSFCQFELQGTLTSYLI